MPAWPRTSVRASSWASDRARTWAVVAVGLACASCTEKTRPIVAIDVVDRSGDPAGAALVETLEPVLVEMVSTLDGFERRAARPDEQPFQIRAVLGLATDRPAPGDGMRHRAVGVSLRLWSLDRAKPMEVTANGLASDDRPEETGFEPVARAALAGAMERLNMAVRLRSAPPTEVVAALRSDDDAERAAGISAAAGRRLAEAVEPLGALLESDSLPDSVALDIVGALVAIGDPRGVGPIIETVEKRPAEYWPQILFAAAELGGRRAEGFLFTVSKGHDDPRVRAAAREALAELERRKGGAMEPEAP